MSEAALSIIAWEDQKIVTIQQKLSNFVQQIQSTMPQNTNGFPLSYIDATVIAECIPFCDDIDAIPEDKYKNSIVSIEFEDGLPVVSGVPFWERLDGEKLDYYKLFKSYRDMKYEDISTKTYKDTIVKNRSIARVSEELDIPGKLLTILSKMYHWLPRAASYDVFKQRDIEMRKRRRQEELEAKHTMVAADLLDQAVKYLDEHPSQLNPKVAMQMIELGMRYGRISAGLLGDKPGTQANQPSVAHQTNIAISQSNQVNSAEQMAFMNTGSDVLSKDRSQMSAVERQVTDNMLKQDNLMSVLHVLNKSGALQNAMRVNENEAHAETSYETSNEDTDIGSGSGSGNMQNVIRVPYLVHTDSTKTSDITGGE